MGQITDQFMQFTSQSSSLQVTEGEIHDKVQEVCTSTDTVNSISPSTNTITSTSTILNQVAHMALVDAQSYKASDTPQELNVNGLQLPATMGNDGNLVEMYPVKVLTGTTNSQQVYVLSMTFDDGSEHQEVQEDVCEHVMQMIDMLQKEEKDVLEVNEPDKNYTAPLVKMENFELDINGLQEPQRSSTPKFQENGLNETIIEGNIANGKEPTDINRPASITEEKILHNENSEKSAQMQPGSVEEGNYKRPEATALMKTTIHPDFKEKENLLKNNLTRNKKIVKPHNRSKLCVADVLNKNFNIQSTNNDNEKYCSDWVSKNLLPQEIAQNE